MNALSVVSFLQTYNGAVTAIATAVIAAFTIFLALTSRTQAKLTREALVFDKRAFIFPWGLEASKLIHPPGMTFRIRWKNSGDTPTRDLEFDLWHALRDTPLPGGDEIPERRSSSPGVGVIPPHEGRSGGLIPPWSEAAFEDSVVDAVNANTKFLYIAGYASYLDIFDNKTLHVTRFLWRVEKVLRFEDADTRRLKWSVIWRSQNAGNSDEDMPIGRGLKYRRFVRK